MNKKKDKSENGAMEHTRENSIGMLRTDWFLGHAHGLKLVGQITNGVRRHVSLRVGSGAVLRLLLRVMRGMLLLVI